MPDLDVDDRCADCGLPYGNHHEGCPALAKDEKKPEPKAKAKAKAEAPQKIPTGKAG